MSEGKKGLHPIAWVAIGCGGLAVLVAIVLLAVCGFAVKKIGDAAEEFERDPGKAAEMIINLNPDLEVVERDPASGTMTIRNTNTGEEVTVNYDDVKNGRISFESSEGEGGSLTFDQDGGGMTVESGDSKVTLGGAGSAADVPEWVPIHPDAGEIQGSYSQTTEAGSQGAFSYPCDADLETLKVWYAAEIEKLGMVPNTSTMSGGGQDIANVAGEAGGRTLSAMIVVAEGTTTVTVQYGGE